MGNKALREPLALPVLPAYRDRLARLVSRVYRVYQARRE
jgi:hypothetical protein